MVDIEDPSSSLAEGELDKLLGDVSEDATEFPISSQMSRNRRIFEHISGNTEEQIAETHGFPVVSDPYCCYPRTR
jgi:hypothetical protein